MANAEGMKTQPISAGPWIPTVVSGLVFGLLTLSVYSQSGLLAPGITSDEPFNARQGLYLTESLRDFGLGLLSPESWFEVFNSELHLPDHPPLGRLAIGIAHAAFPTPSGDTLTIPLDPDASPPRLLSYTSARMASVTWFAMTVLIATRWLKLRLPGWVAFAFGLSMLAMPRLIGHAQLASLETCVGFWFSWTVLVLAGSSHSDLPTRRMAVKAGILLGFALLSKIQGVLLLPPVCLWMMWRWRFRGILSAMMVVGTAGLVFIAGWPWLWQDSLEKLIAYFARTTDRIPLQVWYANQQWTDTEVPWHFPWTMLALTVPTGITALSLIGCWTGIKLPSRSSEDRSDFCWAVRLIVMVVGTVLLTFTCPGIAVYDADRLFLVVQPLLTVLAGIGMFQLLAVPSRKLRLPSLICGLLLLSSASWEGWLGWQQQPCLLSAYNQLAGGIRGAEAAGMELDYWGQSFTDDFLGKVAKTLPESSTVDVVPVAHPILIEELELRFRRNFGRNISVRPLDHGNWSDVRHILSFRRQADLPWFLRNRDLPGGLEALVDYRQSSVRLAVLLRVSPDRISPDHPPR